MKQIKVLGVLAIALTLGLAACGKGGGGGAGSSGEEEHVHTFETAWSSNSTKHWHKATCGHNVKGDEAEHTFGEPYDVVKATCTEAGSQKLKCTVCEYVKTETLKALGHDAAPAEGSDAWTAIDSPSCEEVGHHSYHCSKCDQDIVVEIPALGHQYKKDAEGNDLIEWTTAPTCEAAGVGGHRTCERCHEEIPVSSQEAAALGHDFHKDADGNIEFTWTVEPTCEKPGVGTKHCDRCNQNIAATDDERKALGHIITAIGGETTPTDGTAAVRLYSCSRCHDTFMGFAANEVTNESKAHVAFEPETVAEGEEQGARFLGRPIGNAIALKANGDSQHEENGELVYCSTETGDFIEYAFNLNETQAQTLATCRCYVDAKPANYLNGTDFWAYSGSNDEWTPGHYIDGGDDRFEKNEDGTFVMVQDHERPVKQDDGSYAEGAPKVDADGNPVMVKKGKRIEDFRYVLYVDGQVVDFDDTENPTHGNNTNMTREEFVMPYTFHLHAGLNKIKLVMAGGYRSLLYKFVFRPYEEPTPVTVNQTSLEVSEFGGQATITSSMTGLTFKSDNATIASVNENGVVTGNSVGKTTIRVSKEGNYKEAKVPVEVKAVEGKMQISGELGAIDPANGGEWYVSGYQPSASRIRNLKKDSTVTFTFDSRLVGPVGIVLNARGSNVNLANLITAKLNDTDLAVSGSFNSANSGVSVLIGEGTLKESGNKLVITTIADNSPLNIHYVMFVPRAGSEILPDLTHHHSFANPTTQTDAVASVLGTCECGLTQIRWDANKYDADLSSGASKDQAAIGSDKGAKLSGDVYNKTKGTASEGAHVVYKVNAPAAKTGAKLYIKGVRTSSAVGMFSGQSNDGTKSYYEKTPGEEWVQYEWRYKLLVNDVEVPFVAYTAENPEPKTVQNEYVEYAFPCTFDLKAGENKIELQKWGGYTIVFTELALEY